MYGYVCGHVLTCLGISDVYGVCCDVYRDMHGLRVRMYDVCRICMVIHVCIYAHVCQYGVCNRM